MRVKAIAIFLTCLILFPLASGTSASEITTTLAQNVTSAPGALASSAAPTWLIDRIDRPTTGAGDDRGAYTSVALKGSTPFVSYYDVTNKDLRLAHPVITGGNCGPNNSWYCELVDDSGDVGQFSSIAIDPSTSYLHLGIVYYDATNQALRYASYACPGGTCGWNTEFVDVALLTSKDGRYAKLKFDSTGKANVVFTLDGSGLGYGSHLVYAYQVASGGNCGYESSAAHWICEGIDNTATPSTIEDTSFDLDGLDRPYVSYYVATTHDLKLARYVASGGNCGDLNAWQCTAIDTAGDVGRYSALALDLSSPTIKGGIAYYDATNFALKIAAFSCSGVCGATTYTIYNPTTGLAGMHASLQIDTHGNAHIAFEHSDIGADYLKHAYSVTSGGNCGEGLAAGLWQCDVVDNSGSGTIAEGDSTALAINSAGLVTIAYHESYLTQSTGFLKVAHQGFKVSLPLLQK